MSRRRVRIAVAGLLLTLAVSSGAAPALAADPSIGRINHAGYKGRAHCTGFVARGGHVITAAHCMPDRQRSVHFLAGYDRARYLWHLESPRSDWRQVEGLDIAILCSGAPGFPALSIADAPPEPGETVMVEGYATPRSHVLQTRRCEVVGTDSRGRMEIGCRMPPGMSGAPVLIGEGDGRSVVGVVSSTGTATAIVHGITPRSPAACD
ncbi:MAG: trypsin-like serine peptidase [Minwuia sp.]|uniref:trypsin-like serine peptidase n=1 Tax=Minwuia sp. TaxID=2493630 RepID=UPI003A84ED5D